MMHLKVKTYIALSLFICCLSVQAQDSGDKPGFAAATETVDSQLKAALAELDALRTQVALETLPLSRGLNTLEKKLVDVRLDHQQTSRLLDGRTLDLSNLNAEIKSRTEEKNYLANLLGEYGRSFEANLHIAEAQRYQDVLEGVRLAQENTNMSPMHVFSAQTDLVNLSIDHIEDALGGAVFEGSAVDPEGVVKKGRFLLLGPTALFAAADGTVVGTAEQRLGSLEPSVFDFNDPLDTEAAGSLVSAGSGTFPLDPTLGNAHKVEETSETLVEHIRKGGAVMYPILGLAAAAMLVALYKWLGLLFVRNPSRKYMKRLLEAVASHDRQAAAEAANKVGGPAGKMLKAGVEHIKEPAELIEEIMYERVLTTRLKLQRMLPFIAICAASAPLLGLLGTVTGIINTFKLITVFGSGDVKTLSGGISEALITTKFGLIVAIPSLLLHAFLSRKAKGVIDRMEKAAVSFVNQLNKTPFKHTGDI